MSGGQAGLQFGSKVGRSLPPIGLCLSVNASLDPLIDGRQYFWGRQGGRDSARVNCEQLWQALLIYMEAVILLLVVAKIIKAPFFFVAVGSKANVGGAASAPVIAAAFHPALAPVGVLLAVLGYALGTYGAILCAQMMAGVG